jgi:DNA invertase Pin-like site-specific DNA recombinase
MVTKRAAIYQRISRDDGSALGVQRQEAENRALAEQLGWEIVEPPFTDNDISAFKGARRPAFEELVEAIKDGRIDGVIAWHPDRLTRRPSELEALIDLLEANNVAVATCSAGTYDLTSPAGRMNARIVGATARYESEQKAARLRSQRAQLATSGGFMGGPRPFGFERNGVDHEPVEAQAIRDAAEAILDGRSLSSVSAEFFGGRARASVKRILVSPRIAGLRQHRGSVVGRASWAAIIDEATWRRVVDELTDPRRRIEGVARSYLLAGLVWSTDAEGHRERQMISRPTNGRRQYITDKPKDRTVDAERLEALVVETMLCRYDDIAIPATAEDEAIAAAEVEVVALRADLDELAALRGAGEIELSEWLAARAPLQARLEAAEAAVPKRRVPRGIADLFSVPGELRHRWQAPEGDPRHLPWEQRRSAVRTALSAVGVGPAVRGAGFDPSRVSISWRS